MVILKQKWSTTITFKIPKSPVTSSYGLSEDIVVDKFGFKLTPRSTYKHEFSFMTKVVHTKNEVNQFISFCDDGRLAPSDHITSVLVELDDLFC